MSTEDLAAVLAEENRLLAVMDLAGAAALLPRKQRAAEAFAREGDPARLRRLRALAEENRARLGHAIGVQQEIIAIVQRAARGQAEPPGYGATGAPSRRRLVPLALHARA